MPNNENDRKAPATVTAATTLSPTLDTEVLDRSGRIAAPGLADERAAV
ncbi:dihydroorotase-like cyclic amidohydrolase [Lipingzhangella halophila]|uniref:Dihydroorotase-like cyclic amidohydrolase n=1 Tax=Lipingzhangella halophila TaxID=1783352 RepID=A0A7W7RGR5_9ACTN|nr:hypothetical protein [Lipingzhangella halophila]MBB4931701.1 dihydroorotase-like cyclic amidohydrolase [Lipingzhangella halophila]